MQWGFWTIHPDSLLLLSARPDFLSDANLAAMYGAASAGVPPRTLVAMDYEQLSCALCSPGDVVIKTWGTGDDLYRNVMFISRPDILFKTADGPGSNIATEQGGAAG